MTGYELRTDLLVREIEGETVILDRQNDRIHTLNPTASFIWNALSTHPSAEAIVQSLTEAFDVDPQAAAKDVNDALDNFGKLKLISQITQEE